MRRASLAAFIGLVLSAGLLSGTASGSAPRFRYHGTTHEGAIVRIKVGGSLDGVVLRSLLGTPARPEGPRAGQECTIVGTRGDDELKGTQHDDVICALAGDDGVSGMDGNDMLRLGRGNDSAGGGGGDDVIRAGPGGDEADGGAGNDRFLLRGGGDEVIDYHGRDVVYGGAGDEYCLNVRDGHGGDVIHGGPGRDHFFLDDGDEVFSAEVTDDSPRCG